MSMTRDHDPATDAGARSLWLPPPVTVGEHAVPADEAHHLCRVLRLGDGARVRVFDGTGVVGDATLEVTGKGVRCRVEAVVDAPAVVAEDLALAVAPPKGSRFDAMVRALTELGVGAVHPLRCARGVREPKLLRAERAAREACKQCGRARLPAIGPALAVDDLEDPGRRIILADPEGAYVPIASPQPTLIVVGPEGGFTADERERLLAAGAEPMRLGAHILRIETAAVAAAACWVQAWGAVDA